MAQVIRHPHKMQKMEVGSTSCHHIMNHHIIINVSSHQSSKCSSVTTVSCVNGAAHASLLTLQFQLIVLELRQKTIDTGIQQLLALLHMCSDAHDHQGQKAACLHSSCPSFKLHEQIGVDR